MKHLYNPDGSLTDEGALIIHTIREHCARIFESCAEFPVNETMTLVIECVTSNDLRDIAQANYNIRNKKK
jgi:hypothetical protein